VAKFRLSLAENHITTIYFTVFFFPGEDAKVSARSTQASVRMVS